MAIGDSVRANLRSTPIGMNCIVPVWSRALLVPLPTTYLPFTKSPSIMIDGEVDFGVPSFADRRIAFPIGEGSSCSKKNQSEHSTINE